jgi:hypothetical protein
MPLFHEVPSLKTEFYDGGVRLIDRDRRAQLIPQRLKSLERPERLKPSF